MNKNISMKYFVYYFLFACFVCAFLGGVAGCGGSGSSGGGITPTPSPSIWLEPGTAYHWQVEACTDNGFVTTGPQWSFTTASRGKQVLSESVNTDQASLITDNFILSQQKRSQFETKTFKGVQRTVAAGAPDMIKSPDKGSSLAYVYHLEPCGYVVVPCANSLPPVLAYSFDSDFSMDETCKNVLLHMIRRDITLRLKAESQGKAAESVLAENRAKRAELLSSGDIKPKEGAIWGPLFSFGTWGQEDPYYNNCPMDPETGLRCVVGCVATSLAQHINYWQSPSGITFGSSDSYTTASRKIYIDAPSASFSGFNFNGGNPSAESRAVISYACGVLVRMNYTSDSSGASMAASYNGLKERLGYSAASIEVFYSTPFTSTGIVRCIKSGVPVIMGITNADATEGHALNTDGYDEANGTFHLSCGWAGRSDGWYVLPDGMPEGFSVVTQVILDAYPDGTVPVPAPTMSPSPSPTGAPSAPETPYPSDGAKGISTDSYLYWLKSSGADYYNIYIWKAGENKPSQPASTKLTQPCYKPEND